MHRKYHVTVCECCVCVCAWCVEKKKKTVLKRDTETERLRHFSLVCVVVDDVFVSGACTLAKICMIRNMVNINIKNFVK